MRPQQHRQALRAETATLVAEATEPDNDTPEDCCDTACKFCNGEIACAESDALLFGLVEEVAGEP